MSGYGDDEAVDAFGRIIKDRRGGEGSETNRFTSEQFDHQRQFGGGRSVVAGPRGDYRGDPANKTFRPQPPNFREERRDDWNYNNNRGSGRSDRREIANFSADLGPNDNNMPMPFVKKMQKTEPIPTPALATRIPPIMSFKSYMQNQHEDLSPEVFQRMYEQYHLHYLQDFSDSFFKASMAEEWFQDRYSPVKIHELELETSKWASQESVLFAASLRNHSVATVHAMRLDPLYSSNAVETISNGSSRPANVLNIAKAAVTTSARKSFEGAAVVAPAIEDSVPVTGRHLVGHEDRTICISGVHACCPKHVLKSAIIDALAKHLAVAIPAPDRIVVAQPIWSDQFLEKFQRTAWVVMPTAVSARQAAHVLRELTVKVPGPMDPIKGEAPISFSFVATAAMHVPRAIYTSAAVLDGVQDYSNHYLRVQADTDRAIELSKLLDEDRSVPAESRLQTILELDVVLQALDLPTDMLDVAIAYLRRVHFVNFYGGKRYRDESHLLTNAPFVIHRNKPYIPDPNVIPRQHSSAKSLTLPQSEAVAATGAIVVAPTEESKKAEVIDNETAASSSNDNEKIGQPMEQGNGSSNESSMSVAIVANEAETITPPDNNIAKDEAASSDLPMGVSVTSAKPAEGNSKLISSSAVPPSASSHHSSSGTVTKSFRTPNIPRNDRYIDAMINDLKAKLALRAARVQNPSIPGTIDEEDTLALQTIQEKSFENCVNSRVTFEKEKCRCCYAYCNKLFKNADFIGKHLRAKHPDFAADILVQDAEPFMRKRFEAEDMSARPLPPVEIESHGRLELKSVKEILDKYTPPPPPPLPLLPPPTAAITPKFSGGGGGRRDYNTSTNGYRDQHHSRDNNYNNRDRDNSSNFKEKTNTDQYRDGSSNNNTDNSNRRWSNGDASNNYRISCDNDNNNRGMENSGGYRKRGQDDRDRRSSTGSSNLTHSSPPLQRQYVEPRSEDNFARKISSYLDVDAPKESAVNIDYGVALLPPVKKRKLAPKKAPAIVTASETAAVEPSTTVISEQ